MIDLHVVTLAAPPGRLWLAGTRDGVLRLGFGDGPEIEDGGSLARHGVLAVHTAEGPLRPAVRWLRRMLDGRAPGRRPRLDLRVRGELARRVLGIVEKVPPGVLVRYTDVARQAGSPQGARAVGQILRANPLPLFIPCHRVITARGELAGYIGGVVWKRFLLELESVQIPIASPRRRRPRAGG